MSEKITKDKLSVRRQKIFAALDEMRAKNENISAQKLAARVNMGKQTVLPIYREWLELESLTEAEKIEISEQLQLAIKRELAKEKFALGEAQRNMQEVLNESNEALAETTEAFEKHQQETNLQKAKVKEQVEELNQQTLSLSKELTENKTKLQTQQQTLDLLNTQLEKAEKQQKIALKEQETRLDNAHRQIIDYWINIVDTERKEKEQLRKQNEQLAKTLDEKQQIVLSLQQSETHLQSVLTRTSAELKEAEQEQTVLSRHKNSLDKIIALLGNPDDLYKHVSQLQESCHRLAQEEKALKKQLNKLTAKLGAAEKISNENIRLEHENIKLNAFIEGLKSKS